MRRKIIYLSILLVPISAVAVYGVYSFFDRPATCFDGIRNQSEEGVDCGGECTRVCQEGLRDPVVSWQQAFPVSENIYNAVAYVRNPNVALFSRDVGYTFSFYDENNLLITEVRGRTTIPPKPEFPVFIGGIDTNGRIPMRTAFELEDPFWEEVPQNRPELSVRGIQLTDVNQRPRISAAVHNDSTVSVSDVVLIALIRNTRGDVIHASQTYVPTISSRSSQPIVFTWRVPFGTLSPVCPSEPLSESTGDCDPNRFITDVVVFDYELDR